MLAEYESSHNTSASLAEKKVISIIVMFYLSDSPFDTIVQCRQLIRAGGYNHMRGDIWTAFLRISETRARKQFDYKVSEISRYSR